MRVDKFLNAVPKRMKAFLFTSTLDENTPASVIADGMALDVQEGLEIARDGLLSGKASQKLSQIITVSSKL